MGTLRVAPDHAIASSFRAAIEDHQLTGAWWYFVLCDAGTPRVLGAFVSTPGGRLLYCPTVHMAVSPPPYFSNELNPLAHITLEQRERGTYSSHLKGGADRHHEGSYRTVPPAGLLVPWFTLLLPNASELPVLPQLLVIDFTRAESDLARFGADTMRSGGVSLLPIPTANEGIPTFLQVDVWAGMTNEWQSLGSRPIAWAYKPDVVRNPPAGQQQVVARSIDVRFSDSSGVRVIVSRPSGELTGSRILLPMLAW